MNHRLISDIEIYQRQLDIRNGAHRARYSFSISGIRQLFGSTFIALGHRITGQCEQQMETLITTSTPLPARGV